MTIRNLLTGADKAIEEDDAAMQERMAKEFDNDMAIHADNPLPISNLENKVFEAKCKDPEGEEIHLWDAAAIEPKNPKPAPPKSPEDMEKEYISEAEKAIEECKGWRSEHLVEIERLKTEIGSFDRVIAGKEAFLSEVESVPEGEKSRPKPKTPKKTGDK